MKGDFDDPKALIREAYNIEAITRSECRSIFWIGLSVCRWSRIQTQAFKHY